jgi:DNA invertase Pin-like site-specific DNA recombinase
MDGAAPQSCVAYYRVSTQKQGKSGLGLEAQQRAVHDHMSRTNRKLLAEMTEIESGKNPDRPKLAEALKLCRLTGAKLIVARLDRLARNVAFVSRIMEAGADFEAVDFPQANRFTVHILAAVAEYEARLISERTRAGLAAAKARGVKLGGFRGGFGTPENLAKARQVQLAKASARIADLVPTVAEIRSSGIVSSAAIARELNARGIRAARGGPWSEDMVHGLLSRLSLSMTLAQSLQARREAKLAWMSKIAPVIAAIRASGYTSSEAIARELNARGIPAYWRGRWYGSQVRAVHQHMPPEQWQPMHAVRSAWIANVVPIIAEIQAGGCTAPGAIARELNARSVRGVLGGKKWRGHEVRQFLMRLSPGMQLSRSRQARAAAMNAWLARLKPTIAEIRAGGCTSMTAIARELNTRGIPAYLGGRWGACQVRVLMRRMGPQLKQARSGLENALE